MTNEEKLKALKEKTPSRKKMTPLEVLEKLTYKICSWCPYNKENMDGDICSKCEEEIDIIKTSLKALDIIKKECEFGATIPFSGFATYYDIIVSGLTPEDYDFIREVLK